MNKESDRAIERIERIADSRPEQSEYHRGWHACLEMIKAAIRTDEQLAAPSTSSRIERLEALLNGAITQRLAALENSTYMTARKSTLDRIERLEVFLGDDPRIGTIASRLGVLEDRREGIEKRLSAIEARQHGWSPAALGINDMLARLQRLETMVEPTEAVVNALAKWTRR